MRKLILHIGLHKTGSTAVQDTLHWQREKGLKFGLYYPEFTANLSRVLYTCFAQNGHTLRINRMQGLDTPEKLKRPIKTSLDKLRDELSTIEEPITVMSAEGATRLPMLDVQKMANWLRPFFDEIDIVAYVRPPRSLLNSLFQQEIRFGKRLSQLIDEPPIIDYRARLEPYFDTFGDKVSLKVFSRELLHQNCIVADFLRHIGIEEDLYDQLKVKQKNASLSWPATLYLDAINEALPIYINDKPNKDRQRTLIANARKISGERFSLPYEFLSSICAKQDADIKWIEQHLDVKLDTYDLKDDGITNLPRFLQDQRDQSFTLLARHFHDMQKEASG